MRHPPDDQSIELPDELAFMTDIQTNGQPIIPSDWLTRSMLARLKFILIDIFHVDKSWWKFYHCENPPRSHAILDPDIAGVGLWEESECTTMWLAASSAPRA
jgi:hypothetical protein